MAVADVYLIWFRQTLGVGSAIWLRRPPDADSAIRLRIGQGDQISPSHGFQKFISKYYQTLNQDLLIRN